MTLADYHLHGWDVSHYQPTGLNFSDGGRVFVILKATEGVGVVDPHFAINRNRAHQQGMTAIGAYHFARPGQHSAADEATHFLAVVGERQAGEFAVLDYEVDPWSEGWAATWLHAVKAAGWPVVFYTYRAMLSSHPHGVIKATGAALWVASYGAKNPDTGDWPWAFWQHTDGQDKVSGDDSPWDCSVFHSNDINDLAAFVGNDTPQPSPQPEDSDDMDFICIPADMNGKTHNADGTPLAPVCYFYPGGWTTLGSEDEIDQLVETGDVKPPATARPLAIALFKHGRKYETR